MTARFCFYIVGFLVAACWARAGELTRQTWKVDGVTREALVHVPAKIPVEGAPLVFAFHGHGGTMLHASRSFPIHELWPEAIVVYPQGLLTPGVITDREGKRSGWQVTAGAENDRDLKFFDAMLADLRTGHRLDAKRIYATGHSNGGAFAYQLWAERGEVLAALAPSAALLGRGFQKFTPKPVFHVASESDELVKFAWQRRMLDYVLKLNGCPPLDVAKAGQTLYPSTKGAEVAVYLHSGGHRYPADATALIVEFFKAHPRP